jgi:cytochrome c oxidase subunit 2
VRRGSIVRLIVYGVLAGTAASLVAVLVPWLPDSASEEMDRIVFTFWFTTVICIAIFAIVAAVIVYCVLRFRAAPDDDRDGPPIHGHTLLEIYWTAIPAVLVTAIAIASAIVLAQNDRTEGTPLRVKVTAQQFAWSFEYANGKQSGDLYLPVDRSTKLELTAREVIHSFWVPEFGQKQDAVPGIETGVAVTPTKLGRYDVICTELCGLGHAIMRARAIVVEPAEYRRWVQEDAGEAAGDGS